MIHVSGKDAGYLATDKAYRDYRVAVEYKWGKETFGSKYVRNSGILLHAVGPDGGGVEELARPGVGRPAGAGVEGGGDPAGEADGDAPRAAVG